MPELAEVETVRLAVETGFRGKRIVTVICRQDPIVFDELGPRAFTGRLRGQTLIGTGRKGKFFWLTFDGGWSVLMHLGMTGWIEQGRFGQMDLRFARMQLEFEDETWLAFTDPRRLGRIRLRTDPLGEPPVSKLGFDVYLDDPGRDWFAAEVQKRKAPIKAILLDQGFTAGIGNWLADEILFQARIDPRRRGDTLTRTEARAIYRAMKRIVNRAVKLGADDTKFPNTWLFHHRWGKNAEARTSTGDPIEYCTVGGRTTAWVPTVQV